MVTAEWVKEQGRAVGFDRVGVAPATDLPELALFPEWLERGYAGELDYMRNPKRRDVRELLPDARSVICCALVYDTEQPRSTEVPPEAARGWISRYAWGEDYHGVIEKKLEALRDAIAAELRKNENRKEKIERSEQSPAAGAAGLGAPFEAKLYVDTGPVLERVYAKHAGLGWQGKNTCLLDAELGSFFFIGVLVTNLELAPDAPPADACGACTLCLEACPTGALVEPYVMDARRCISYLTIELRDAIPEEFRASMGRHVFGCDICQDVCPYNRKAGLTELAAFEPRSVPGTSYLVPSEKQDAGPSQGTRNKAQGTTFHPRLDWLASLTEADFKQVFRTSAVKRARWRGLVRNALVAMGNSGNQKFRAVLEKFTVSDDPLLAQHAQWALAQLAVRTKR